MQMYLGLPLVLHILRPHAAQFRSRVTCCCIAAIAFSLLYQTFVICAYEISLPLPLFAIWDSSKSTGHSIESQNIAWAFYIRIYTSLLARLADMAAGILVYIIATSPAACSIVRSRPSACTKAAAVAALGSIVQSFSGIAALQSKADLDMSLIVRLGGLVGIMGAWSLLSTAWLLLWVIIQPDAASKQAAALLSSAKWDFLSERSYSVSLLHWPLLLCVFRCIPVTASIGPIHSLRTFAILYMIIVVASLACATIQDWLIDVVVKPRSIAPSSCRAMPVKTDQFSKTGAIPLKANCQAGRLPSIDENLMRRIKTAVQESA